MSKQPRSSSIYVAFVPWVLFSIITQHASLEAGALAALAAAILIALRSIIAGRPKVLEIGTIAAFAGFTAAGFALDSSSGDTLGLYARAIAAGLLALIAFASLLGTPFTEQYARESVPREFWSSPRFEQINRELTRMWGLVFALMVPSHVIAGALDTPQANKIFNWAIPIALVIWAVKRQAKLTGDDAPATDPGLGAHAART